VPGGNGYVEGAFWRGITGIAVNAIWEAPAM
jgi:hypothetical protein